MYTLYLSYNVNISALFLTGFLSGAFFAPFLGSAVDKFGRKNSCIVYCALEIIINVLEHSTDFRILLLGRVLGGISTNLLFSAFESWMTTEHRKKGFPEEWLSRVYSVVSTAMCAPCLVFARSYLFFLLEGFDWQRGHGDSCRYSFSNAGGFVRTHWPFPGCYCADVFGPPDDSSLGRKLWGIHKQPWIFTFKSIGSWMENNHFSPRNMENRFGSGT